jgi:acetyl esterase
VIGPDFDDPGWAEFGTGYGLDRDEMAAYWAAYVPDPRRHGDPDVAPDRAQSLAGLAPALVITAGCDPLRAAGERYAAALAEAGVDATATCYLGAVHGFWRRPAIFAASRAAIDAVSGFLARRLD